LQGKEATGDFTILMASIQLACKVIGTMVRKAGILGHLGLEGSVNVQVSLALSLLRSPCLAIAI
jgi:fructose-1,6-bisphosphatase